MTTDKKTLADVQPGGRVRLGDQADAAPAHDLETIERVAKAMQASEQKQSGWTWADCSPIAVEGWMDLARAAVAALSAQPSPGGQGDVPSIDYEDLLDQAKDLIHCGCSVNGAFEWLLEQLTDGEALAARQPVNESPMAKMAAALRGKAEAEQAAFDQRVQSCEWGPMPDARTQADFCQRCDGSGWDGESREIKCQSCAGAGIAARQPVEFERAIPTRRRESAVELLLELGFVWNNQRWEDPRQPVGESVEEDVYCAIADMIEPYVQREGINPEGVLPASVHDSVAILLDHWVKTRQPVGEISDAQIDARLNAMYREMVDSGQHNGGMSGVAWDRAVYRMASSQPAQAVGLGAAIKAAFPLLTDYGLHHSHCCEYKLIDERHRLHNLIDSQDSSNG